MLSEDNFNYAIENTRIVVAPEKRIETFGNSLINYYLVTEDMDDVTLSRVREGQIQAERPQVMAPQYFAKLLIEGFGEKAQAFANQISQNSDQFGFLKYGFRMKKAELRCYDVHDSMETVLDRVKTQVADKNDPMAAILTGVDDAWEVSLLKFMVDLVQSSAPGNFRDLKNRGLL